MRARSHRPAAPAVSPPQLLAAQILAADAYYGELETAEAPRTQTVSIRRILLCALDRVGI